ncbi:MAG TPA: NUDIX domain-containing protein [Streptosporangiaceae bacterium]|nr:NUDIX domain-containing protein [Streptosporangiaceae bacterium]
MTSREIRKPTAWAVSRDAGRPGWRAGRPALVRRRDTPRWEPPGGVLELDEPIHAGLCREVREESGLTVEPVTLKQGSRSGRTGCRCAAPG